MPWLIGVKRYIFFATAKLFAVDVKEIPVASGCFLNQSNTSTKIADLENPTKIRYPHL